MNPFSYNGGAMVAMAGKDCIGIAADRRLGKQFQTITTNFQKVFKIQDDIIIGITGLATDVQTFASLMEYKVNMYQLRENRKMKASTFASLVSSTLYEHRFGPYFVSPIVIGLENGKSIVATYDSIGCKTDSEPFATGGTAGQALLGLAESYYKDDLSAQELEDTLANCLVSGIDRDVLSGWTGAVYILSPEKLDIKVIKMKQL